MIRDPSDGTVREPSPKNREGQISGLPDAPAKSDELIRLERSREWVKNYNLQTKPGVSIE